MFTPIMDPNFFGAKRELQELVKQLDTTDIASRQSDKISWHFNPPLAPHFGGIHEVMIGAAKRAIFAVLKGATVTDEELVTAIAGAEALLNSRPLTYSSADHRDQLPLTPNHFLHGRATATFAASAVDGPADDLRRRWRFVQNLVLHFWRRWMREWLPGLNKCQK